MLKTIKLGDYLTRHEIKNSDNSIKNVMGVSVRKVFRVPTSKVNRDELCSYLIVLPGQFSSVQTTHNEKCFAFAYNDTDQPIVVSSVNLVFSVDETIINPRWLQMYFNRKEFDRYARFHSWGSAREIFGWDELCNVEIELPPISIQNRYVSVYEAFLKNIHCYESGLQDLKLICDGFFDKLKKDTKFDFLGNYVSRVDIRNIDNSCKKVMSVSTSKEFKEPTSKVNKDELNNYKICKPRQISFVQTTHNEKVFCNAMNRFGENIVVTSVNEVFECDESRLMPEFLCMYFNRKEFDRYARFHSWGSAREVFSWNDLVRVKMPIPSIEMQKSIVAISDILIQRKECLLELRDIVSNICPILIRGSILEAKGGKPNAD